MNRAAFGLLLLVPISLISGDGSRADSSEQVPIAACPAPLLSTSSWSEVDQEYFTFRLPTGFREVTIAGPVDSWSRQFESADSSTYLTFDWGYYSDPLTDRSAESYLEFSSCDETIGGRVARIVAIYPDDYGDSLYGAGASWRDVRPNVHLTLYGWSRNRKGLDQLLRIFRTVRFEK